MDLKDSLNLIILLVDELASDVSSLVEESAEVVLDSTLLRSYQRLLKADFSDKDLYDALNRLEQGMKRLRVGLAQQELKPSLKRDFKSLDDSASF
jgi:hypothetical protein